MKVCRIDRLPLETDGEDLQYKEGAKMKMKKQTVGKRIFFSNAVMILVTVILVVLINVGVIKEEKQQKRFLETAYRRTGDMDVLLNQLFYLSKLETGNMPLYLQETDLHTWISRYVEGK